ncbi:MAG: GTPase Era [Ectothiorhodospiraceae bacterium]|nr:GTPase Era [Ectothiorhodospiraceae bacterium]MCH8503039.1 GTPase Era [Ectothiorhodospiraceae bacterium]
MTEQEQAPLRCGFVAIAGRPNVGKSTLLNRLLGMKISIVSRKPQTTRNRIVGISTRDDYQVVYVDTPGIHGREARQLNRMLNRNAVAAIQGVDLVVFVVEALKWTDDDALVLERIKASGLPVIAAVNKVDLLKDRDAVLPYLQELSQRHPFEAIIPMAASRGVNVDPLEPEIARRLPRSDVFLYPEDQVTDRSERFLVAELVREQLMRQLGQEVPYSATVEIERFRNERGVAHIHAAILVERDGQKAIVIGKGGRQLKEIGQRARHQIEQLLGRKVYLELWVKVREGWSDDERALRSLGFEEG